MRSLVQALVRGKPCLTPEIERVSLRNIFKSGEAFLFSLLVRTVQQLPKIF
jgi:hypothetical protein